MVNFAASEYVKIAEAARILGVTQRWVYHRILNGELPASKVGGLYLIQRKALDGLIEQGQVVPSPKETNQPAPLPPLKCGFCFRLLSDDSQVAGLCESEGCSKVICRQCWELDIHFCNQHSPSREQRWKQALVKRQQGLYPVLVKASTARLRETGYLNRIHQRLAEISTLIHPETGEVLTVSDWSAALQSGDERADLMNILGRVVLDAEMTAQMPLNAWHTYHLKSGRGRRQSSLQIHVQAVSRLQEMARDGFDTQGLNADDLNLWLQKTIDEPTRGGDFRLVLLAATTGWAKSARAWVSGGQSITYHHRLALLYLFDLDSNELVYNKGDDRASRYAELFRPLLAGEELDEISREIERELGFSDAVTLESLVRVLPYPAEKIQQALRSMADQGKYVITEMEGLGVTLVKKQAL